MSTTKIISVANQKGGVGKTTTVMNLGHALAAEGKRVLLVDSDPQGNLTRYLGVQPKALLDELYLSRTLTQADLVPRFLTRCTPNLQLIGCDSHLAGVEYYLFSREDRERVLASCLSQLDDLFDFVLIDTPPSLNLLTLNALVASHQVIVPVQPEFFSLEGLSKLRATVDGVRSRWNPALRLSGIVVTQMQARRKLVAEVIDNLESEFGELVFETRIRENSAITESSGHAQPVFAYAPRSHGALDYQALAEEFLKREG